MEEFGVKDWLVQYKKYKKEFWRVVAVLAVIIIAVALWPSTEMKNEPLEDDFFSAAILEYEVNTGKKIYPTGREFLQRAKERDNLTTKEQVLDLIKANEKYMWK